MSSPTPNKRKGNNTPNYSKVLTSSIGKDRAPGAEDSRAALDTPNVVPTDGDIKEGFPRPALPPPLPPVERDNNNSNNNNETSMSKMRDGVMSPPLPGAGSPGASQLPPRPLSAKPPRSPQASHNSAGALPLSQSKASSLGNIDINNRSSSNVNVNNNYPTANTTMSNTNNNNNMNSSTSKRPKSSASNRGNTLEKQGSNLSEKSDIPEDDVEQLIPLNLSRYQPIEKFFVQFRDRPDNHQEVTRVQEDDPLMTQQARNDNELLLEQFAEYTDDDSFFSSSSQVIEQDPSRWRARPDRPGCVSSVKQALRHRQSKDGSLKVTTSSKHDKPLTEEVGPNDWLFQVHNRDIALQYSSFFIFPARWTPRVVVYNVMHHWLMEMMILLIILGYAIFQATWGRYTSPKNQMIKPDHILWADVFYTVIYGIEMLARLFATGLILHPRSYLRSMWHWLDVAVLVLMILECTWWQYLWNFTAWRLIRCIKCLCYVPAPVRIKLLAKSLLRSTNRIIQVCIFLLYFIFFFGLIGLQLFNSTLRNRCVSDLFLSDPKNAPQTNQICRSVSSGHQWFYWGHHCAAGYTCVEDVFGGPHFDLRNFDDIGHAMLATWQVVTNQGWTSLLTETNDGKAVLAFLWYAFTILICTWIIPSLFLGVFIEKIEKTGKLYVLKQLDRFDRMITEQRQRLAALVRIHDFVERDEEGRVPSYPAYGKQVTDDDTSSDGGANKKAAQNKSIHKTNWTDEQRIQLHLSFTRQKDVAEEAERKRLMLRKTGIADQVMSATGTEQQNATRLSTSSRLNSGRMGSSGPSNFALGGRVGAVQHHPSTPTIGASRQTELSFAARQDAVTSNLKFLDPYQNVSNLQGSLTNINMENSNNVGRSNQNLANSTMNQSRMTTNSMSRPPLGPSASVLATRESAGVVPNMRSMSVMGSMSRLNSSSAMRLGSTADLNRSTGGAAATASDSSPAQLVIQDPEGGDFGMANGCKEKFDIIRNILHMFTEGYPRILTQYLWEQKIMTYRYGLNPLSYTNKYEEEALRKLRRQRAQERIEERNEMRRLGMNVVDSEEDEDMVWANNKDGGQEAKETQWMREEGLVMGSMSPIRMARNIQQNAPITVFNYIMLFFFVANAVFNASRFDTMPDYWEMGVFVAGVCFSVLFMLELIIRFIALGPGPFLTDLFCLIEATFMVISLFQLGFSRSNTVSCFNWVRFLRFFRVIPIRPLRRVSRVLIHGFPDIAYAVLFFTFYMFMWLLLGMSFFGNRFGWINYATDGSDYSTRGNFETFSHAAYAVAQAFSVNRDQWLYMSWTGMRVRGSYTVMYFIATVLIAFIFRFFFIAVMTNAWQAQEEAEDYLFMSSTARKTRTNKLPWFDFTVWRSFKHIHGGFERRDVAPDEVYFINEDMQRQLRLVEAKDRYYKEQYQGEGMPDANNAVEYNDVMAGPTYINVGGQIIRQPSIRGDSPAPLHYDPAQLRFQQNIKTAPANDYDLPKRLNDQEAARDPRNESRQSVVNPLTASRHSLTRPVSGLPNTRGLSRGDSLAADRLNNTSVSAQLVRLGKEASINADESLGVSAAESADSYENYEHLLLPGPRLRYKNVVENGRRVFERCLDCGTHKQMPLCAPLPVMQRSADELHAEHCHMSAVRSSRQVVLNALLGYARMQAEHEVRPNKRMVETVLGQAWSCGMLLFETIENISCMDLPEPERNWNRLINALEVQQWVLSLHVGEEQVGRATLAYILASQKKQEIREKETTYKESWQDYTFFALAPSNPFRRFMTNMVESWWFELISLCVIYAASICLAVYAPGDNNRDMGGSYNGGKYKALHVLDDIFAVIFAVEMVIKWIAMGVVLPVGKAYFWHRWNIVDCFIVIISLVSWGKHDIFLRYLKVMRCFRILGPLRFWKGNKSMAHVALAIWDSIPILANVCLIMLMNYIVWAILFVSMFMNKMNYCSDSSIINGTQCKELGHTWQPVPRNFRNWYESLLTTYEISTGAEWMDVMYYAVDSWSTTFSPVTNRHPYLGLVFIAYYYLAHFVLFSLFVSGVIYCYLLAKNAATGAAGISFEHQVWLRMQNMILSIKPRTRLIPFGNPISRGLHKLVTNIWFERFMALILTFNMVTMALHWRGENHAQTLALDILQWIFVGIFTVEIILRFIAHGLRNFTQWCFCWDVLVTCLSYIQIGLNTTDTNHVPFNVNVLRMLRVGRFLSLVNLLTPFETFFSFFSEVLWSAFPSLVNVTLIYMLSVYIFAILGLHFLGYIVPYGGYIDGTYNNFQTFVNSLIMVFRLSTLENWATMLRGSLDRGAYCSRENGRCGPTNWAPVYYIPIVICFYLILQSLYLAVIIDRYVAAVRMRANVRRLQDLRRFCALWTKRDPNNTMLLPTKVLPELLEELRLPLGITDRHNRVELLSILREYEIPDRNGKVHYYDVLIPLARRVMAQAFHDNENTAGQSYDLAWRLTERSLNDVPYYTPAGNANRTAAEFFATTYVQAAFRRNRAIRDMYIRKSELWRAGRLSCDNLGLPYDPFGFGKTSLGDADPRLEGEARGFHIPEGATLADAKGLPLYLETAKPRPVRRKESNTLLPTLYRSAIEPKEKKFGPDVPNAIKRGERRSDKLERRRAEEDVERQQYLDDMVRESAAFDETAGDAPNPYDSASPARPPSSAAPGRSMSQYHVDENDTSYQPPLGTDPEFLRQEELIRRSMNRQ